MLGRALRRRLGGGGRPTPGRRILRRAGTFRARLIAATTTTTGLKVRAQLDQGYYPTGIKVTDKQLAAVPLRRHDFHGDWNYTISPTALTE